MHDSINPLGGGERLCLSTIEALKEHGYEVTLVTFEPTDWLKVKRLWGKLPRIDREIRIVPLSTRKFTIYTRLFSSFFMHLRKDHDLIINTHGDVLLINADITYMHFPTFALWNWTYHKYEKGFWRIYFTPYYLLEKKILPRIKESLLLTNSKFSKAIIRRTIGKNAVVVYPPVEIKRYIGRGSRRENRVVTIGRFSPEKRYEFIVEVASRMPDIEFHIIGSTSNKASVKYFEKIKALVEEKDLKNVYLHRNMPQKDMDSLLLSSKVYFHAMINEHFGIAVVEGMAAGLVPVVHKSGGAWFDIVNRGKYGFGYNTLEEAVKNIRLAIKNYAKYARIVSQRASIFSVENYKRRILRIVDMVIKK